MKTIWYHIRQFFQSVNNLIVWFPIIWNDRHWDDEYILTILHKKLFLMEQFYRGPKAHHLYALNDAENIHVAVKILDRILAHNYLEEALVEEYYPKYFEIPELEDEDPEKNEAFRNCGRASDKVEQEDFDLLFDHLKKHIREWWD